jgi:predicted dehydrogenase
MLDFDTSHTVEFTKRLNHAGIAQEQWVDGARVVVGCPGESRMAPERIAGYAKEMEALGVPLVERHTDMIGRVDGMLIESLEGGVHLERARPFLEAGLPCFIDKPFACSAAGARAIADLAARNKAPVFSASSLRYAPELLSYLADPGKGRPLGVVSYGPAPYLEGNPGLFHYGIHALEALYALMGPGCAGVACTHEEGVDVVTGRWQDGRAATLRGIRAGRASYGFLAFGAEGVDHVRLDTTFIYRELLKKAVVFFQEKRAPLDVFVTIEMMAFMEAALRSACNHGTAEAVAF